MMLLTLMVNPLKKTVESIGTGMLLPEYQKLKLTKSLLQSIKVNYFDEIQ